MYLFRNIRKNEEKETETATKISPQLANLGLSVRIFMAIYTNFIYGIILYFCFSFCAWVLGKGGSLQSENAMLQAIFCHTHTTARPGIPGGHVSKLVVCLFVAFDRGCDRRRPKLNYSKLNNRFYPVALFRTISINNDDLLDKKRWVTATSPPTHAAETRPFACMLLAKAGTP